MCNPGHGLISDRPRGTQPGDPAKAAAAIMKALEAQQTPLRLPLGGDAVDAIAAHLDTLRADLTTWEQVARDTAFEVDAAFSRVVAYQDR